MTMMLMLTLSNNIGLNGENLTFQCCFRTQTAHSQAYGLAEMQQDFFLIVKLMFQ